MNGPISQGYKEAEGITKKFAKTFYFASRFLPKEKRLASYSIYAICRISDETVDKAKSENYAKDLDELQETINNAYSQTEQKSSLLLCFRETVKKYEIPKLYFDELISGMRMDLEKSRYRNFEELYKYCYKVAGVVGLMMAKIFKSNNPDSEKYAVNLGVAMQLTNILRDIKEDLNRNRIYLPGDELEKSSVSEGNLNKSIIDENFKHLMEFQINRARQYYADSSIGIKMIGDLKSRFVVLTMRELYSGILKEIERNKFDVFTKRAHVSYFKKIFLILKLIFRGENL
ncbi:MAG: phytoene/squalene synthase family protein [Candidatus Omnitrophica bacterium]|nr:phytoene/squalene synthase family protein [Candidatus Omnitrophota bacterium]